MNGEASSGTGDNNNKAQQEYFVPWHLPYHHAEVSSASAIAVENGFAKKDDKKRGLWCITGIIMFLLRVNSKGKVLLLFAKLTCDLFISFGTCQDWFVCSSFMISYLFSVSHFFFQIGFCYADRVDEFYDKSNWLIVLKKM